MIRFFVSRHFAFFPKRLSGGRTVWWRSYYAVHQYQSSLGEFMVTKEEFTSATELAAKEFKLFLENGQRLHGEGVSV